MQLRRPAAHECCCRASTQHLMRFKLSPSQWAVLQCSVAIRALYHSSSGTCVACDRAAMIPVQQSYHAAEAWCCSGARLQLRCCILALQHQQLWPGNTATVAPCRNSHVTAAPYPSLCGTPGCVTQPFGFTCNSCRAAVQHVRV